MKITPWMLALAVGVSAIGTAGAQSIFDRLLGRGDDKKEETESVDRVAGIREALAQGTQRAVELLGKEDGFLASEFRIPVPDKIDTIARTARRLGQDKYVDAFEASLNRAAEQAVPAAAEIFGDAIRELTVEDALGIVRGDENAATAYFRRTTGESLFETFHPIVTEATAGVGVTAAYKDLTKRGGGLLRAVVDEDDLDLDRYVTERSIDALFVLIGREEARIRQDPAARATDLLRAVFSGD